MVFYRKYRPQTISELDSSKLRETLTAVLSREDVPHAFLLTGPKGLGKTSTARIIAKVVNCTNKKKGSIESCNECEQCVSITNGNNLDILEIDGASNRGIDEIRDLRDKVKLAPSKAKKKVYIIDEVHMLTTEAFNALLKTIEEPPEHVMFIFCTTEPQKVPETILSRCFHLTYPKATEEDIVNSLERVIKGEKITFKSKEDKEKILHDIAKRSGGGFRDATKLLEEIVIISQGETISEEKVVSVLKTLNLTTSTMVFFESLLTKNPGKIFQTIQTIVDAGIDIKTFIGEALETLHNLLLQNINGEKQSYDFNLNEIKTLVTFFSEAYQQTKYAVIQQLPLELAVVEWCTVDTETTENLTETQKKNSVSSVDNSVFSVNAKHTMDSLLKKEKNLKVQSILRGKPLTSSENNSSSLSESDSDGEVKNAQEKLSERGINEQFIENLIYKVKPINFSVAGVLRGCVVKKLADGEVVFETTYKFHKEKLDEVKTRDIIEKAIKEITGKEFKVVIELTNKDKI